ncbi:MAG: hypothetical protein WBK51_16820 [Polaromonas sp.]
MDPVALALTFFLQNPSLAMSATERAMAPGTIDVARMQGSLVDLSRGVLHCYHRTARYSGVEYLGEPFIRQTQYGAEKSMVLRIRFAGMDSLNHDEMVVAVMGREDKVRAAVLAENALIPYNKRCALEEWVG